MALKPKKNRRSKTKVIQSGIKTLFEEYCSSSSVHGVRYFTDRERSRCEKYWWAMLFLLSIGCCGWLICTAYQKWIETPVIVSFDDKTTPVWKIPLPAVTICPRSKVSRLLFDFPEETNILQKVGWSNYSRTDEYLALMQICDQNFSPIGPRLYGKIPNKTSNESYISLIANISSPLFQEFEQCKLKNQYQWCETLFSPVLTEEGICYTFNSLSEDEMLRTEILSSDRIKFEMEKSLHWSLENGYSPKANISSYPYRTVGAGAPMGLGVLLYTSKKNIEMLCSGPIKGFKVLLHSPADYPQLSTKFIDIPINQQVVIAVKPQILTTTRGLQSYSPERRQCYFNKDRKLDFFRVYTQDNCRLECLTKYMFQECGCVKFSMMRTEDTPVCETNQTPCMRRAEDELMQMDVAENSTDTVGFSDLCNCLPACTSIEYDVETIQNDFDLVGWGLAMNVSKNVTENEALALLSIYYKEPQFITSRRSELYGLTQFLANCGGLLGLFMGTSLLSVVELCYYCSVRPFMLRKKWKQMQMDVEQGDSEMLPRISLLSMNVKKE